MNKINIGICVIAYNRVLSLGRVLDSLAKAYYDEHVTLIISVDKSDNRDVVDFAHTFLWEYGEKRVIEHSENLGLRKHVLKCGDLLEDFDALIVLEDDVSVAPSFYVYARQCVERFQNDKRIAGISLYNFPYNYQNQLPFNPMPCDSDIYLMQCAQSWGQVWMRRAWQEFREWYENNNEEFKEVPNLPHIICQWPRSSWLKYHTKYCIEKNKYFVYPYVSLSTNNSDAGTHCKTSFTLPQSIMLFDVKKKYNLNPLISYDGFFESEMLYQLLGMDKEQLCIDFYGEKHNRENKRFWLTRSCEPYVLVDSFGLSQKTYEWNIINNNKGNIIFLYDTSKPGKMPKKTISEKIHEFKYLYKVASLRNIIKILLRQICNL